MFGFSCGKENMHQDLVKFQSMTNFINEYVVVINGRIEYSVIGNRASVHEMSDKKT